MYFRELNPPISLKTSKVGVTLDLDDAQDATLFRRLAEGADLVLEGEAPGRLAAIELDYLDALDARELDPALIWVSITPFGRDNPRSAEPAHAGEDRRFVVWPHVQQRPDLVADRDAIIKTG